MKIAVWDTYVQRLDGSTMHFDILVPDHIVDKNTIVAFGEDYMKTKAFKAEVTNWEKCSFCHIASPSPKIIGEIAEKGYSIIELSNCN